MKKAIILIGAISVAIATQAVQVAWNSGLIYLPDSSGALTTTQAGSGAVQAYYFVVDAAEHASFDAKTDFEDRFDVNSTSGAITLKEGVNATYNRSSTGGGMASWAKTQASNTDIAEGSARYVFAFYTYTDANKKGWYVAANPYASVSVGALEAEGTYDGIFAPAAASGWTPASAVPEPTTVALLALGLAAVGLKRKVA